MPVVEEIVVHLKCCCIRYNMQYFELSKFANIKLEWLSVVHTSAKARKSHHSWITPAFICLIILIKIQHYSLRN